MNREEANWNHLPNEVLAHIASFLDLPSLVNLARTAVREMGVVHEFSRNDVHLDVTYSPPKSFEILLRNEPMYIIVFRWSIQQVGRKTTIIQRDARQQVISRSVLRNTHWAKAAFKIVGNIFKARMFNVKVLKLSLGNYRNEVDFGYGVTDLEDLYIFRTGMHIIPKVVRNFVLPPKRLFVEHRFKVANINALSWTLANTWTGHTIDEVYINMGVFLRQTNAIYRGHQEYRDHDGRLNYTGFRELLRLMRARGTWSTRTSQTWFRICRPFRNFDALRNFLPDEQVVLQYDEKLLIVCGRSYTGGFFIRQDQLVR